MQACRGEGAQGDSAPFVTLWEILGAQPPSSNIFYAVFNYALAKGEGEGRVIFNVQFHTERACLRKCVCSSNEKHVQFTSLLFSDQRV